MLRFSRMLAFAFGLLAPGLETIRRWSTWREDPPALLDDYVLGAFLLLGAWWSGRPGWRGRAALAAAWGFTCGIGYLSFFGQLRSLRLGVEDPAPIASEWVAVIKGGGLAAAIAALVMTLRAPLSRTAAAGAGSPREPQERPVPPA